MSFYGKATGYEFKAGHFLANNEDCTRVTKTITPSHAQVITNADGSKYVPAGAVYPTNNSSAIGILYEDVDVTGGAMPCSVITEGVIYGDKLPTAVDSDAASAMAGIKIVTSPAIVRPDYPTSLTALTVNSSAGTAVGDTAITVSGYELESGDSYKYKVATGTAPAVAAGDILSDWTAWNGTADITAATDKKITVAVVNAFGEAIAAGNTTVTAKAS